MENIGLLEEQIQARRFLLQLLPYEPDGFTRTQRIAQEDIGIYGKQQFFAAGQLVAVRQKADEHIGLAVPPIFQVEVKNRAAAEQGEVGRPVLLQITDLRQALRNILQLLFI